jgi:protoheme IX farnesyltransferase
VSIHARASLSQRGRIHTTLIDCLALTKPRTIHLVVGVIPAMLLAERGVLAPLLIVNVLIGAILMTAGGR